MRTQDQAFVRTYTFRMESKESFINDTPNLLGFNCYSPTGVKNMTGLVWVYFCFVELASWFPPNC